MTDIEYDLESLKKNLDDCDRNIQTFQDAIAKEHATKAKLQRMITALQEKQIAELRSQQTRPTKEQRETIAKAAERQRKKG